MFHSVSLSTKRWIISSIWGIAIVVLCIGYHYLRTASMNWYLANRAVAFSAAILILLSHVVSGTSYFWGIGKSVLAYRKSLGVVGFIFGLLHGGIATVLYTNSFSSFRFFLANPFNILVALTALGLFTFMVIISNFGMPAKLGALRWRFLLRVSGYTGIILITIHIALFSFSEWKHWFTNMTPYLPPLNLLLVIFSILTLLLRVCLWYALSRKKREKPQDVPSAQPISTPSPPPVDSYDKV